MAKKSKTVIKLYNEDGELNRVELSDENATTQAIAQAAIGLITSRMSLSVGDVIEITEE